MEACQTSTVAFGSGSPVSASVTWPCMKAISPSEGVFVEMLVPFSRMGASARQKGPRMAESVGGFPALAAARAVMSSQSLRCEYFEHW